MSKIKTINLSTLNSIFDGQKNFQKIENFFGVNTFKEFEESAWSKQEIQFFNSGVLNRELSKKELSGELNRFSFLKELIKREKMGMRLFNSEYKLDLIFCLKRAIEILIEVSINTGLYTSFKSENILKAHSDEKDILVFQLDGMKEWIVGKDKVFTLNPGDVLFIPKGTIHEAKALTPSSHLTLSLQKWQSDSHPDSYYKERLSSFISQNCFHESLDTFTASSQKRFTLNFNEIISINKVGQEREVNTLEKSFSLKSKLHIEIFDLIVENLFISFEELLEKSKLDIPRLKIVLEDLGSNKIISTPF